MAKETWGPFDEPVTIKIGEGKTSRGEFGIPAGKILSFDADGRRVFSEATVGKGDSHGVVKPIEKPQKKAPAKKKAPSKKKA